MGAYYDGTKLLSMRDLDGNLPEIFICTANRTGGKTTYFNRLVINKFLEGKGKFCLVYRFTYELDSIADKFFKDISKLFFPDKIMVSEKRNGGMFTELFLQPIWDIDGEFKESCGYAIALNSADSIKKLSHLFSDVKRMLFDEFQSETNKYCPDELRKFQSVHTSIARGQGEMVRYVPVYMVSNPVSIINPYYVKLGISERLRDDTKFLKGHGFVLEQGYVESASTAQKSSGFNRAFADDEYLLYSSEGVYLNDNKAFIQRPSSFGKYLATIKYMGREYAIREYAEEGIIYCDDRDDTTFKYKIAITTEDHNVNYVMLKKNDLFVQNMRYFFERGCFRFKDLRCKEAVMKLISY